MANGKGLEALLGAPVELTDEVYIPRLKAKVTVKSVTNATIDRTKNQALVGKNKEFDGDRHDNLIIAAGCVDPDFNDSELRAKFDAFDAADCVYKALHPGERIKILAKIMELSGFSNEEEEIAEIKN
ncbi:hypothetical protein M3231_15120 [Neobacillus mesonae]|nr:hypothetical protein [Neobacillus mesonae]